MNRPLQVQAAIFLLSADLLMGIVGAIVAILLEPEVLESLEDRRLIVGTFAVSAVITVLYASLIYFAARRRNWARLLLLVLIVALIITSLVPHVIWLGEFDSDPWWVWTVNIVTVAFEIIALVLLFSRPAANWYRSPLQA